LRKVLNSSAILFDAPKDDVLAMLHSFFPETQNTNTLEGFRSLLLTKADLNLNSLLEAISQLDENTLNDNPTLTQEEIWEKSADISAMIEENKSPKEIAHRMHQLGLLGGYSISCPPGSKKSFSKLNQAERKFVRTCGNCGAPIFAIISTGYICPKCNGIYQGC